MRARRLRALYLLQFDPASFDKLGMRGILVARRKHLILACRRRRLSVPGFCKPAVRPAKLCDFRGNRRGDVMLLQTFSSTAFSS